MEKSTARGSQTFEQDLFRLYKQDIITLEEALSHADSPTNLQWIINNDEFTREVSNAAGQPVKLVTEIEVRTGAPEQWTGTWAAPSYLPHTSDFWLSWRHSQGDIPPCLVLHPGETQPHRQHFQLEIITPSHPQ